MTRPAADDETPERLVIHKKDDAKRCGTTHHHPKPESNFQLQLFTVVWIVVVTIGRSCIVLIVVSPRAAAQHAFVARLPRVQVNALATILA